MVNATNIHIPSVLDAIAPASGRATKLAQFSAGGALRRPPPVTAAAVTVMTALERHKPSTVQQYNVSRRMAARWMKAEGLAHLTFASFRHLVWDLEDAGYCGSTLRLAQRTA